MSSKIECPTCLGLACLFNNSKSCNFVCEHMNDVTVCSFESKSSYNKCVYKCPTCDGVGTIDWVDLYYMDSSLRLINENEKKEILDKRRSILKK